MTEARVSVAEVRRLWADRSILLVDAAARLGVHPSTLSDMARRLDLPKRWCSRVSDDDLRRAWMDPRLSTAEISEQLGLVRSAVWRRAKILGLPARSRRRRDSLIEDLAEFDDMWRAGVALREMARHFGRHWQTVSAIARARGLPPRRQRPPLALTLADFQQIRLAREMARTAAAEQAAMKARGMLIAPGVAGREAA